MVSAKRGAAQVSVVWIITFGVIALAAIFFGYVAQDDHALTKVELARAETAAAASEEKFLAAQAEIRAISTLAGATDPNSATVRSDTATMAAAVSRFKEAFPQIDAGATTLTAILPPAEQAYRTALDTITNLNSQITRLESEVQTVQRQRTTDLAAKDEEIRRLGVQLRDEQGNATERQDDLQGQLQQARAQSDDLDREVRSLEQQIEELTRNYESEVAQLRSRLTEQGEKLAFLRPAAAELADARIIRTSSELGLAWIDIGSDQRLARGVGFRVVSGQSGASAPKAFAEVTQVMSDMAEVRITGLVDPFDPVVPGDALVNELYDPTGVRNAILIGRFSGGYDEAQLRVLLERMGIHVQDELALTTDFAIVGSELYVDEFGEAYEEPLDPSELPVYGNAVALGVKIVPIQQVRQYFQFD
jgi:hypothetical protein